MEWSGQGVWVGYQTCDHVGRDREAKGDFLKTALDRHRPGRVLDLGANDGYFSEISLRSGAVAIAVDGDEGVLDAWYRKGTRAAIALSDLTNPSPAQGWAGTERPSLTDRARPDLVIAYGLIHHLIYTASVPPATVVDWLASFRCPVVVEFVSPRDEMVGKLTANKTEAELHHGREQDDFERLLRDRFEIVASTPLGEGTRTLYSLTNR
jgi:hypothetical protein